MATVNVYINNGNPTPDPAHLQNPGDILVFNNQDSKPHLIELWTGDQTCTEIGIYLPASPGTVTLVTDPNDPDATVWYNVLTPGVPTNPSSGSHGIIIGSGMQAGEAA